VKPAIKPEGIAKLVEALEDVLAAVASSPIEAKNNEQQQLNDNNNK
jgi:hypothetical protein